MIKRETGFECEESPVALDTNTQMRKTQCEELRCMILGTLCNKVRLPHLDEKGYTSSNAYWLAHSHVIQTETLLRALGSFSTTECGLNAQANAYRECCSRDSVVEAELQFWHTGF